MAILQLCLHSTNTEKYNFGDFVELVEMNSEESSELKSKDRRGGEKFFTKFQSFGGFFSKKLRQIE